MLVTDQTADMESIYINMLLCSPNKVWEHIVFTLFLIIIILFFSTFFSQLICPRVFSENYSIYEVETFLV